MKKLGSAFAAAGLAALVLTSPRSAEAQPHGRLEFEPHGAIGWPGPFRSNALALGARLNYVILENGFIPGAANNVAIGTGGDIFFNGAFLLPFQMQWDFYPIQQLAFFGEPGLGLVFGGGATLIPILEVGGKFFLSNKFALTARAGYPLITGGLSIFF
jgi:hypothetical protein